MTDRARGRATLFISYSHTQREHMQLLKKHLEGALFGRGVVWSDEALAHGSRWETGLRAQLKNADAALLLVAPDYLASEWCRRELKILNAWRDLFAPVVEYFTQAMPGADSGPDSGAESAPLTAASTDQRRAARRRRAAPKSRRT